MKIAIMQPYFMPYIGYFQLISAVDKFVLFDDVNYIKKGWINRNNIIINKQSNSFTIPLIKPSQNKLIYETFLSEDTSWKAKLIKTIVMNYKKTSQFDKVFPLIESIINYSNNNLSEYIHNSIIQVCNYLEINTEIEKTSRIYSNNELNGQERIIDICLQNKTTTYINPIGGIDLYNKTDFTNRKLNLQFIYSEFIEYNQNTDDFIAGLSIIDLLMNIDTKTFTKHLNSYKFK